MKKPINLLEWDMQFILYKSMLKTAGTLCSKIKELNSNVAEYNKFVFGLCKNIHTNMIFSLWGTFKTIS